MKITKVTFTGIEKNTELKRNNIDLDYLKL